MRSDALRDFAERVKDKVAHLSGGGPPLVVYVHSEEEKKRKVAEYEARWGPGHDYILYYVPEDAIKGDGND